MQKVVVDKWTIVLYNMGKENSMGTKIMEGKCYAICGYEEDYLEFLDNEIVGISELVSRAAQTRITSWQQLRGWEYRDEYWEQYYDPKECPKLLKVKITIEAEELPEKESKEELDKRHKKYEEDCEPCP